MWLFGTFPLIYRLARQACQEAFMHANKRVGVRDRGGHKVLVPGTMQFC